MKISHRIVIFHLLMLLISYGITSVIFLGYYIGFVYIQNMLLYPKDTIYGKGAIVGEFLAFLPPVIPCFVFGLFMTNLLVSKTLYFRKTADKRGDYHSSQYLFVRFILMCLKICIPLAIIGFFNYSYITETKIVYRNPFLFASTYSWDDVNLLESKLFLSDRTNVDLYYILHMRDGNTVKLNPPLDKFYEIYPQIYNIIKERPGISLSSNISISKEQAKRRLLSKDVALVFQIANFKEINYESGEVENRNK